MTALRKSPTTFCGGQHLRINVGFWGDCQFDVYSDGKKELRDAGHKWMMAKLESIENMCHTQKIVYLL